ncbi:vWA domain-containing protein [Dactylococcopsis salina]|uniref:Mg chelatase, cobalamin biosynthesis protein CobN n=1 Tax=Dactylococcopsis salina (strain PCC 8305) TaxID=13035 RepID=K9Z072_DACS8|nr:VWA domain-containing protein [Dactylococcopsis salina]AFZ52127.1 Mg chelatase, cobalamin biosynthesis protein CobN [Dactylococcopsis salina PCC 8305]
MEENALIRNRDYTLLIDKSQSMSTQDQPGGKSRWEVAQESTYALAKQCEEYDPDGITVYLFSSRFRRYDNVTSGKVSQVYAENDPMGKTDLLAALEDAIENYFQRKAAGETKPNGETILVITDGEPEDRKGVMRFIIETSRKLDRDDELGISLIQVGEDAKVTEYLKALDDQLLDAGAKFDIVDTITMTEMGNSSLPDVLLKAITD